VLGDQEFPASAVGYQQQLMWSWLIGRPDRRARLTKGKSDPLDAVAASRAALSGQANSDDAGRWPSSSSGRRVL
jgi:transposase